MASPMLTLTGAENVIRNMEVLNVTTQRKIKRAIKETADYTCETAKTITPVSPDGSHGNPKGTLRDGNKVRVVGSETTGGGTVREGGDVAHLESGGITSSMYMVDVRNDVFYAGFVELGTKYMKAKPFLQPAFAAGRMQLYARILEVAAF